MLTTWILTLSAKRLIVSERLSISLYFWTLTFPLKCNWFICYVFNQTIFSSGKNVSQILSKSIVTLTGSLRKLAKIYNVMWNRRETTWTAFKAITRNWKSSHHTLLIFSYQGSLSRSWQRMITVDIKCVGNWYIHIYLTQSMCRMFFKCELQDGLISNSS